MNEQEWTDSSFQVFVCTRPGCEMRLTVPVEDGPRLRCPVCRAELQRIGEPYPRQIVDPLVGSHTGPQLEVLLDNIRSAWNVGSMLRTCDGAGVRRVHLCGVTASAENPKVIKTALGAEKNLAWSFHPDAVQTASLLKSRGLRLWALEGGPRAESLFEVQEDLPGAPILLVAGNEVSGVDPGIMDLCERVVCLPMHGMKGSLNVAVAFGIAVYFIRFANNISSKEFTGKESTGKESNGQKDF